MTEAQEKQKNQIARRGQVTGGLASMGSRQEIREVARRLRKMAPGGMRLENEEAVMLAQYAYSMGANPLNGEVWFLKNEKTGKALGVMPGIKLYRRRADEKDERTGDSRWLEYHAITNQEERAHFGLESGDIGYRAHLYRTIATKAHAEAAAKFAEAGAPWDDIREMIGHKPYTVGIGILRRSEIQQLDRSGNNKMPHDQRAMKRAEAHALKQAYHLPFGFVSLSDNGESIPSGALLEDYVPEAEWREVDAPDLPEGEELEQAAAEGAETLYGSDDEETPTPHDERTSKARRKPQYWRPDVIETLIAEGYADDKAEAAAMLAPSTLEKTVDVEPALQYAAGYRKAMQGDPEIDVAEAAQLGMAHYQEWMAEIND